MRIIEFLVNRYGPLSNVIPFKLTDFNLLWGRNEEGKTLTIDALVKLLLGRSVRDFKNIDRVDEFPEGYAIIKGEKSREIKLPEKGDLTTFTGLSTTECRNIFIIRNSDLSIAHEGEFYTDVTSRLTGLRTKEINRVKESLREIGKLTPTGSFRDTGGEKLKSRISDAVHLVDEIGDLLEDTESERYDELEEELVRHKEEIDGVEQRIKELEDARIREKFEKGKEALQILEQTLEELSRLENYNEDDEKLWRDSERDIKKYESEKEELLTQLKDTEKSLNHLNEKLADTERNYSINEDRKKELDESVKIELREYDNKRSTLQEGKSRFATLIGIISTILLGISLVALILNPSILLYVLVSLFTIAGLFSWIYKLQFVRAKTSLEGSLDHIKRGLAKFELSADTIEGIYSNIQGFEDSYRKEFDQLQEMKRQRLNMSEKTDELRNKTIPQKDTKIDEEQNKIEEIQKKSGAQSLEEYNTQIKLKRKRENLLVKERDILENLFETKGATLNESIILWERQIAELEDYQDRATGIQHSETAVKKLSEQKEALNNRLTQLIDQMETYHNRLSEIEKDTNRVLRLEDYLHCQTSTDLLAVSEKLEKFISFNSERKENVLNVIGIFDDLAMEEQEKVSRLFSEDQLISSYFSTITDGRYEEVLFDLDTGKVKVKLKDGVILMAEKLSGGAYDQLYFSIRLALGEKLLKGKTGFFVLDDPFVKSDPDRLVRQIQMLNKIAEIGWQIVYFSAKGEVKEALAKSIKAGSITYIDIQR